MHGEGLTYLLPFIFRMLEEVATASVYQQSFFLCGHEITEYFISCCEYCTVTSVACTCTGVPSASAATTGGGVSLLPLPSRLHQEQEASLLRDWAHHHESAGGEWWGRAHHHEPAGGEWWGRAHHHEPAGGEHAQGIVYSMHRQ